MSNFKFVMAFFIASILLIATTAEAHRSRVFKIPKPPQAVSNSFK